MAPDLELGPGDRIVLSNVAAENRLRPAVSALFRLVALRCGRGQELKGLRDQGGITIAQNRELRRLGMPEGDQDQCGSLHPPRGSSNC